MSFREGYYTHMVKYTTVSIWVHVPLERMFGCMQKWFSRELSIFFTNQILLNLFVQDLYIRNMDNYM